MIKNENYKTKLFDFSKILLLVPLIICCFLICKNSSFFFTKIGKDAKKIKVSIVVPIYNSSKYLEECLDSIQNQTLKEIEIICINDGSTDNSLEIIKNHKNADKRIKIIDKKNGGVSAARNAGINISTGKYVTFVDSDDFIEQDMYEKMYAKAIEKDYDLVVCNFNLYNELKDESETGGISDIEYYGNFDSIFFFGCGFRPFIWNKIYKRQFLFENNIKFIEDINFNEDYFFNASINPVMRSVAFMSNPFYYYRLNDNPLSLHKKPYLSRWKTNAYGFELLLEDYKKDNLPKTVKLELIKDILNYEPFTSERLNLISRKDARQISRLYIRLLENDYFEDITLSKINSEDKEVINLLKSYL